MSSTDANLSSTTTSKRWQPPPIHPDRSSAASKLDTSDVQSQSDVNVPKGGDFLHYDTNTKKSIEKDIPSVHRDANPTSTNSTPKSNLTPNTGRPSTPKRLLSAYARTMIGLNPLWLAGEALSSSRKPFTQFNRGRKDLFEVVGELSGGRDIVVVVDDKIRALGRGFGKSKEGEGDSQKDSNRDIAERTAEVIRAAGENALLVVTSSIASLQSSLSSSSENREASEPEGGSSSSHINLEPTLAALKTHLAHAKENVDARAALLLLDKSLKHPVLVAGVREFAQTRGIPHADAVLRLASLGVARLLRKFPETEAAASAAGEAARHDFDEVRIEELSADELERTASPEERAEAERVGRAGREAGTEKSGTARAQRVGANKEAPTSEGDSDPYEAMRKKTATECVVQ